MTPRSCLVAMLSASNVLLYLLVLSCLSSPPVLLHNLPSSPVLRYNLLSV